MTLYTIREKKRRMRSVSDIIRQQGTEQRNRRGETLSTLPVIEIIQVTIVCLYS